MAATEYGVNSPETVKHWRKKLAREALKKTYIGKFIGESDDSLIFQQNELKKDAGDAVTVTLRMQLNGDGVLGDNTLEGNEEKLTTFTDKVTIEQLRHAVRSKGRMSEQRVPWKHRAEAKNALVDWFAGRMDTAFFNQICGYTPQTDTRYTGNTAVLAATNFARQNAEATDQALDSGDPFTLATIDKAVETAKLMSPVIRPIKINGEDKYVAFIHTKQVTSLRGSAATAGSWADIQKAALMGGQISKNPIYTGALGEYNGCVLHESTRVTQGVNSSTGAAISTVRRAVLCGAQAAMIAFGQGQGFEEWSWEEELFDYGNQLGVSAGSIFALKKTVYNSADFGTIVMSSYAG
jgi:N4-gp56 family major capsid protein